MRVREIMTAPVTTLEPTDSLAFAEELMNVERVRHLPVVDGDVLVGLLSHRDVLAAAMSTLANPSPEDDLEAKRKVEVQRVMRGAVETIGPEEDAVKAADMLLTHKVGCLPVVDERHRLIGIVTEADFVALARNALTTGKIVGRFPVVPPSAPQHVPPEGRPSRPVEETSHSRKFAAPTPAPAADTSGAHRRTERPSGVEGTVKKVKQVVEKAARTVARAGRTKG